MISNCKCSQHFNLIGIYKDQLRIYCCILVFLLSPVSNFLLQLGQSIALVIPDIIHFTSPIV
ncbi:hypothetical protein F2X81_10005 [Staphylococcus aureus]|nr:hypothetical protein CU118_07760 [Staphylococcus aureus]MSN56616.1 hypothetical protein [Staphylococcus aureus]MSN62820.1 hypothetical protein [Staphylococcus aureus]MSN65779.1 hypothetical protein [Staphylococcus aureus]MSN71121.1 hypothetical protein [Staphylococcus aureus]